MALPNAIGLSDSVKTFTAPANLAPVHSPGDTWARQGRTDADTSRIGVAEWNYMIGSFRGVINFTPGFDPSARDADDPTLLRDAITAFSTAKIIELLPDAVLDQAPALAAEMAGIPAFVAAVVGAVPANLNADNLVSGAVPVARLTNVNASNLTSGTVPDARLPSSHSYLQATVDSATDFNALTTPGFQPSVYGNGNANAPKAGGFYYHVLNIQYATAGQITQIAIPYSNSIAGNGYWMRAYFSGAWGAWSRIVDLTYANTLYAQLGAANSFTVSQNLVGLSSVRGTNGALSTLTGAADAAVEARGNGTGGAFIAFHRPTAYAALFGLDTDNVWKVGGWSAGAVSYKVHHDGNTAPVALTTGATPYYGARAWVHFNGTGTVAIRSSANVSSITDNGTGDYTINFTTAMPDAEYATLLSLGSAGSQSIRAYVDSTTAPTTAAVRIKATSGASILTDFDRVAVAIMR